MGPLSGIRVLELAGIGPGPFCGMLLADMGAEVIRVDRPGAGAVVAGAHDVLFRSRRTLGLDLKHPDGIAALLRMCKGADALFEGFRPGVTERLGVGPEPCLAANPRLIYGRMTGWGQTGPLSRAAGHDINYIALSGALHAIGRQGERPVPPLNLVGDFGGGGAMLAFGIVCGLFEARTSGRGQVIDASMVEGSAALMAMAYGLHASGAHGEQRGGNLLDTGAPFYEVYETSDRRYVALGAIEPQFFAVVRERLGLDAAYGEQYDRTRWPAQKEMLAAVFRTRTRDEWCTLFAGTDACLSPVLSMEEAPADAHNVARGTFVRVGGAVHPAPIPRFSCTPAAQPTPIAPIGRDTRQVLADFGFTADEVESLLRNGVVSVA